ncbi:heme-binding protein 2 [Aplysia californica]|uniref:Heme-binding protein 2 n=1 Tax=Aplysia californica TaxID=6500 RepID=A0ABM0JQR7_APLCA|nr:heme-binding protein 2 [Aplysia californica]
MFGLVKSLVKGLQKPEYELDQQAENPVNYEVRKYKATKWVCTTVKSISRKDATSEGFGRLFKYIQGNNEEKATVEMTAPVTTTIVPGEGPNCESTFTVAFYLPSEHQVNPPKPSSPDVFFEDRPEQTIYVRSFGGFANDEKWIAEGLALTEAIGDESKFESSYYFTAGYDPPFKLIGRTNEVWFVKKDN